MTSPNTDCLSYSDILRRLTGARVSLAHEERREHPNATLIEGLRREYYWWEARIEKEQEEHE